MEGAFGELRLNLAERSCHRPGWEQWRHDATVNRRERPRGLKPRGSLGNRSPL